MKLEISQLDPWLPVSGSPVLTGSEVHVWRAFLSQEYSRAQEYFGTLSADERCRASRFYFPIDREYFVFARGILRKILGCYLSLSPHQIHFSYNECGKPRLVDGRGARRLYFNIAHANGIALYAITQGREVGVDIEYIRKDFPSLAVAEHFFSAREVSMLRALPGEMLIPAFFNCWTRKEAYIKALGEGLSHPLHGFTVSLAPGEPVSLITNEDPEAASQWSLIELFTGSDYAASLAVRGKSPVIRLWQWVSRPCEEESPSLRE